ncbi:MAG: hypothetical protein ACF8MF_09990 [Phycisphaerales bacterium JB052]
MNQFVQYMLGNAWLLIPILIGLFNLGVRVQQKAKEQKARRDAQAAIARHKSEALRTGKSLNDPIIIYDEPEAAPSKDDRQARIEAIRKQRMEQLRAMREKRASTASPAAPKPRPAQRQTPRAIPTPRPTQSAKPAPQPTRRPTVIPASRRATPAPQAQAPSRRTTLTPQQAKQSPGAGTIRPKQRRAKTPEAQSPVQQSSIGAKESSRSKQGNRQAASPGISARSMVRDRKQIRQAIVLRELLDSPVALRSADRGPGSMQP